MTQQPEADCWGADAAQDVAAAGFHMSRQDQPSGDKADPGPATGMEELPTRWLSGDPKDTTPTEMRSDLARLESAFPAFSFAICRGRRGPRFEAWRDTTRGGLYAVITDDPRELWHELKMAPR